MVSLHQVLVASALLTLSAAMPTEKRTMKPFTVTQVPKTNKTVKNGYSAYAKTLAKYGASADTLAVINAAAAGSVTATPAEYDEEYTCPVTIGSQTFTLDFDTGSSDLWVLGASAKKTGSTHTFYTPGSTATKVTGDTWSIQYGDGSSASGTVYSDTVTIGGTTVTGQYVESASTASSSFTDNSVPEDGLVGLAFDTINTATPKKATTFFTTAINQGLPSKVFTALLKHNAAGSYTFGQIPTSQYTGTITYTNVDSSQGFWGFTPTSYAVGTGAAKTGSLAGIADTGTTLLLLPSTVVSAYYAQVSGAKSVSGAYVFSCTATLPNLTFTINGYKAVIPGSYLNYAPNGDGTCYGGLQSSAGIGINIYGDIFLKSQFVVFDKTTSTPRLGFAPQA